MKVPIQNVFYLFCYAWNRLPEARAIDVSGVESPELPDLIASVLIQGTNHLLRRGVDRGYLETVEATRTLRGRIDLNSTIKQGLLLKAEANCRFDDLSSNVLHNRIVRTTIHNVAAADTLNSDLRAALKALDRRLSGIQLIQLNRTLFSRVQLHANNAFYGFLLRLCELAFGLMLADPSVPGRYKFVQALDDDILMQKVFEDFVRNFYRFEQKTFRVLPRTMDWQATAVVAAHLQYLPSMVMDTVLRSRSRTIVIDTKYYKDALQTFRGARTVHSENLYQLLSYLANVEARDTDLPKPEGILLYPVGEVAIDLTYEILGRPVRVYTLNLAQPWQLIRTDLLNLIGEAHPAA